MSDAGTVCFKLVKIEREDIRRSNATAILAQVSLYEGKRNKGESVNLGGSMR